MKRFQYVGFMIVLAIAVLIAAFYAFNNYIYNEKQAPTFSDYKNAEYIIEGDRTKLRYFGNELKTDLNSDGREDIVFLGTSENTGSGVFYYLVVAINTERGYVGSEGIFIGDRIAPQTTEKGNGKIVIVNYADRAPGEPFTIAPSVAKSLWLVFDNESMQFGEVVKDFEGEADPSRMSLGMKTWNWSVFALTFGTDGKFSAKTDCNSMGGSYSTKGSDISFSQIFSTKMYCEGSKEGELVSFLENAQSYRFTSKGELIFSLKSGLGEVVFR